MKTEIYNLIILDESGSMWGVAGQTINGCNETINTIKASQKQFADTQDHYVSIFAFQSDGDRPSRYLVKNVAASEAKHITAKDYEPCGCTPLYDAVGSTLVDLKATVKEKPLAIGSVTIITDGEENASQQYTLLAVSRMIAALKEMGWNFNFIGANIDVKAYAKSLNIDNTLEFQQDAEGTRAMFEKERVSRMSYNSRVAECMVDCDMAAAPAGEAWKDWVSRMKKASKDYFKK